MRELIRVSRALERTLNGLSLPRCRVLAAVSAGVEVAARPAERRALGRPASCLDDAGALAAGGGLSLDRVHFSCQEAQLWVRPALRGTDGARQPRSEYADDGQVPEAAKVPEPAKAPEDMSRLDLDIVPGETVAQVGGPRHHALGRGHFQPGRGHGGQGVGGDLRWSAGIRQGSCGGGFSDFPPD